MIHLDTSYLIDLMRERKRGIDGPATELARELVDRELWISPAVACELYAGAENASQPAQEHRWVEQILAAIELASPSLALARTYGRVLVTLQRQGLVLSPMDLLIGCAALVDDAPLVTRNVKHFSRIPTLRLRTY